MKNIGTLLLAPILVLSAFAQEGSIVNPGAGVNAALSKYVLSSQVVSSGGTAVPNAVVRVEGAQALTDAQGNFQLQVPPGQKKISISANGYADFCLQQV